MNASALRHYSYVRPASLALTIALMGAAFGVQASDRAEDTARVDPGSRVTARVTDALTDAIDAAVTTQIGRTSTNQHTLLADESEAATPARRTSAAHTMPAPSATATMEHTRLYLAIKDGAESGVLVQ